MNAIKKIGIFHLAKFQAIIGGIIGFFCGFLYSFGGLVIDTLVSLNWITSNETPGLSYGTILAFGALIVMPIIFSIVGFILGVLEALIYTLFQRLINKSQSF